MRLAAPTFVGRRAERERLLEAVEAARQGRSEALVLFGPPGQGKTALLGQVAESASDLRVLRATGVETESGMPFAGLHALLLPVLELLPLIPGVQATALERALALGPAGPVERFAVGGATLSLLATAAEHGPVLCLIDDLQWIDEPSREAIFFAARRLDNEGVAIVLCSRGEEEPSVEVRGFETISLGPLPDGDARRILGELSGDRLPDEPAGQLIASAVGNPLTLLELAQRLSPAELEGREAAIGPPPPNASARELLAERFAALSAEARRTVLVAAAGDDDRIETLRAALAAASLGLDSLAEAERAGLCQLRPDRLVLRHPLLRSVAYHDAAPEDRRAAHAAIAAALDEGDLRRPWHLAAAAVEPDEDIAAALEASADAARGRGGHASAARTARRAAELTPDPRDKVRRLLRATEDFEFSGLYEETARIVEEVRRLTDDPATKAYVTGIEASLLSRAGQPHEARGTLLEQARALRDLGDRNAARFFLQSAFASMLVGDVKAWGEQAREALAMLEVGRGSTYRAALAILASALIADGRLDEAAEPLDEVERLLLERPDTEPIGGAVEVYALVVQALIWVERFDRADRLVEQLLHDGRAMNSVGGLPYLLGVKAMLDARLGRWTSGTAAAEEAVGLADATRGLLHGSLGMNAVLAALRGRHGECATAAGRAMSLVEGRPRLVAWCCYAEGLSALGRGAIEEAVHHLESAAAVDRGMSIVEPGARPWQPDLIEALIRHGQTARAEELLHGWERDAERTGRHLALATAARCRGLIATEEDFAARFEEALAEHEWLPMPFERARTLLAYGERLRRARRRADAREPLREALARFEQLGARDWEARARKELRATGGMVPESSRPELEELTPHEIQVALMVAEGRTNKEVAAALFLAPKTIEHHLSTIFRKLGIKRRTELARVFAGELAGARRAA